MRPPQTNPAAGDHGEVGHPDTRVTVLPVQDRFTFLVDGRGDAVFDRTWGLHTYPTRALAQRAGEYYLRQHERAFRCATALLQWGPLRFSRS